jgi:hypothetical protein
LEGVRAIIENVVGAVHRRVWKKNEEIVCNTLKLFEWLQETHSIKLWKNLRSQTWSPPEASRISFTASLNFEMSIGPIRGSSTTSFLDFAYNVKKKIKYVEKFNVPFDDSHAHSE